MKTISILGCGWLGLPLGERLSGDGVHVKGATTRAERLVEIQKAGIEPFQLTCSPELWCDKADSFFDADALFLNIPFRRNLDDPRFYFKQIEHVIDHVRQSRIQKIIFAGSTSVYPESIRNAVEDAGLQIVGNERAKVLSSCENLIMSLTDLDPVVLRFAGLYGGRRQIGKFLSGRTVARPNSPVNLIHLDDCVAIVSQFFLQGQLSGIYNACSDRHPYRKDLYTLAAKNLGLPEPEFSDPDPVEGKRVHNGKLKKVLDYEFSHPDPMEDV